MFETAKREYLIPKAGGVILSVNIKMKKPGEAPAEIVGEAPVAERLDDLLESGEPTVATYCKGGWLPDPGNGKGNGQGGSPE